MTKNRDESEFIRFGKIDLQCDKGKYIHMERVSIAQPNVVRIFMRVYDNWGNMTFIDSGCWHLETLVPMSIGENGVYKEASGTTAPNDFLGIKWVPILKQLLENQSITWGNRNDSVTTLPTQHSRLVRDAYISNTKGEVFSPKFQDTRYWEYLAKQDANKAANKMRRDKLKGD